MVPTGAVIGRDYYEEEGKIMDAQLALGGLRLAHVLNRILSDTAAPAPVQSTATK